MISLFTFKSSDINNLPLMSSMFRAGCALICFLIKKITWKHCDKLLKLDELELWLINKLGRYPRSYAGTLLILFKICITNGYTWLTFFLKVSVNTIISIFINNLFRILIRGLGACAAALPGIMGGSDTTPPVKGSGGKGSGGGEGRRPRCCLVAWAPSSSSSH